MVYEKEKRYIIPFDDVSTPRIHMPEISVEERRLNFTEVETGFPEDAALAEARRCLSCRRCLGCALCWAECKPEAIDFSIPDLEHDLEFDAVILTRGQDNAFYKPKGDLGYGTYADVITDLQFERMLSPTGPTDGLVLSPRNGEIPSRLAIIQGHPKEGDDVLFPATVLGVNEAALALHRTEGLEVVFVSPICKPFQEQFLGEAQKIAGLKILDGVALSVKRIEEEGPLTLHYQANGQEGKDTFDLIVVLTKPKLAADIQSLSRKLQQDPL
jgi:ferredoxin